MGSLDFHGTYQSIISTVVKIPFGLYSLLFSAFSVIHKS
jgi:hypothetical protein